MLVRLDGLRIRKMHHLSKAISLGLRDHSLPTTHRHRSALSKMDEAVRRPFLQLTCWRAIYLNTRQICPKAKSSMHCSIQNHDTVVDHIRANKPWSRTSAVITGAPVVVLAPKTRPFEVFHRTLRERKGTVRITSLPTRRHLQSHHHHETAAILIMPEHRQNIIYECSGNSSETPHANANGISSSSVRCLLPSSCRLHSGAQLLDAPKPSLVLQCPLLIGVIWRHTRPIFPTLRVEVCWCAPKLVQCFVVALSHRRIVAVDRAEHAHSSTSVGNAGGSIDRVELLPYVKV